MLDIISIPLQVSLLLVLGMLSQWLGWRLRLPAILFLLMVGMLLGPMLGWLNPDVLLGHLLFPIVSMGVAIILFEGSLTLKFSEVKGVTSYIRNLTTLGALITWGVMTVGGHYLADLDWQIAFLFGALVSVTGPTVIVPMLRSMKTTTRISNVLRWEGIIIDPIGAMLAVLVYVFITTSGSQSQIALAFIELIAVGLVLGFAGGWVLGRALKNHWVPDYLTNLFSLTMVLLVFSASNQLAHESGLVAVTVMGIYLANLKDVNTHSILDFKEHLTVLLISMLFILLAARMNFDLLFSLSWTAILLIVVAQFIARPLSVYASAFGTKMTVKELALLSWISPRGIVAAAISALFAIRLSEQGVQGAEALVPLVFILIIGTVVFQSATANYVARKLDLSLVGTQGALIVGANKVSLMVAEALKKQDYRVVVADESRVAIKEARMLGLDTFYGNILSENAELHLDISPLNMMLLMGRRTEVNPLYYTNYRPDFGPKNIYALNMVPNAQVSEGNKLGVDMESRILFSDEITWPKLSSLISKGAEIRFTNITETFTFEDYQARWGKNAIPMFAISPKHELQVFADDAQPQLGEGWQIGAMVLETPAE